MGSPQRAHEIVVIGAGVSGLALAHDLHRAGCDVLLLEREAEPGGCAKTDSREGFLFEQGPFNLLVRHPLFEGLLEDLGDNLEVVPPSPEAKRREIVYAGLRRKVPSSLVEAITTPLLGPGQKLRLIAEPLLGKRPVSEDPTLGDIIRRRFGDALADRVVSAVIAGVYGGDCDALSARSCLPLLWEVDQTSSSLILGFIKKGFQSRKHPKRRWKGMISFRGGVGSFCSGMAASLGDSLFLGTEVESIEKSEEEYLITTRSETRGREVCSAKEIVLSTDLPAARKLLRPGASAIADLLDPIQSVSLAVVNAGFGPEAFHPPPQGFGFLVPKTERDINILGVLFASSVFPHQAPPGCHSVRIFVGGTRSPNWPLLPEGELVEKALAEMGRFIEVREAPRVVSVSRWAEAVPQMVPGHAVRVAQVEENLKAFPGLSLVGNYLRGVSVNDCVVNARETAARILAS